MTVRSMGLVASRAIVGALLAAGLTAAVTSPRAEATSLLLVGQPIVEQSKDKSGGGLNKSWGSCHLTLCDAGQ